MTTAYAIITSRHNFSSTLDRLFVCGYVYGTKRLKSSQEVVYQYGYTDAIIIGGNMECKMVIHDYYNKPFGISGENMKIVTIEEFLTIYIHKQLKKDETSSI